MKTETGKKVLLRPRVGHNGRIVQPEELEDIEQEAMGMGIPDANILLEALHEVAAAPNVREARRAAKAAIEIYTSE